MIVWLGTVTLLTDTAAVSLALEMDCNVVMKATKFDGVYDRIAASMHDATKHESVTFQQVVQDDNIKVMDKAAMGLAMEQGMQILIFVRHEVWQYIGCCHLDRHIDQIVTSET